MHNIRETRQKLDDGVYDLSLEVMDYDYFNMYDNADLTSGKEFLRNYLKNNADDGRYKNVDIKHNKSRKIVNITAKVDYYGNAHSEYQRRGKLQ